MIVCCQYIFTAIANYLLTKNIESTQIEDYDMLMVVNKFIDMIDQNLKSNHKFSQDELFITCMSKSNFHWQLHKLFFEHQQQISWNLLASVMTLFAQTVEILHSENVDLYSYFDVTLGVIKQWKVNEWIQSQNKNWKSVLIE